MKKILSVAIAASAIVCGSAFADNGPAPLSLAELDSVSAGTTISSASAAGGSSAYVKHDAYGIAANAASGGDSLGFGDWSAAASEQGSAVNIYYGYYGYEVAAHAQQHSYAAGESHYYYHYCGCYSY